MPQRFENHGLHQRIPRRKSKSHPSLCALVSRGLSGAGSRAAVASLQIQGYRDSGSDEAKNVWKELDQPGPGTFLCSEGQCLSVPGHGSSAMAEWEDRRSAQTPSENECVK